MASDNEASCESDPNFAVICGFLEKFGVTCGLSNIDFLELQEMLENTQEVSSELIDLHVKLLRKARKSVSTERWERAIIKLCHGFCSQDAWEIERFGYKKARLSSKLRILKELLEMQFDFNSKFKSEINKLSAEELRTQPLGRDRLGHSYWFQSDDSCQVRVYKEDTDEETWTLVAKDRIGLVSLIAQLHSNDSATTDSEAVVNEDSNSLESEKPVLDTGQNNNIKQIDNSGKVSQTNNAKLDDTEDTMDDKTINDKSLKKEGLKNDVIKTESKESLNMDVKSENILKPDNNDNNDANNTMNDTKPEIDTKISSAFNVNPNLRIKPISELICRPTIEIKKKTELMGVKEKYIRSDLSLDTNRVSLNVPSYSSPVLHRKAVQSAGFDTTDITDLKRSIDEDNDVEEPTNLKRPRLDRPTLLGNKKVNKSYSDEEVDDEIEEPLMLVQGEGFGRDNQSQNFAVAIVGEVIEEPVLYFYGDGNGHDCETGNENSAEKKELEANSDLNEANATSSINSVSATTDCHSSITSPTKKNFKLGTIIDVKTDKLAVRGKSSRLKSRWDIEIPNENCDGITDTIANQAISGTSVDSSNKEIVLSVDEKLNLHELSRNELNSGANVDCNCVVIQKESATSDFESREAKESELLSNSSEVSKKTKFFFGPGCLQFNPQLPTNLCPIERFDKSSEVDSPTKQYATESAFNSNVVNKEGSENNQIDASVDMNTEAENFKLQICNEDAKSISENFVSEECRLEIKETETECTQQDCNLTSNNVDDKENSSQLEKATDDVSTLDMQQSKITSENIEPGSLQVDNFKNIKLTQNNLNDVDIKINETDDEIGESQSLKLEEKNTILEATHGGSNEEREESNHSTVNDSELQISELVSNNENVDSLSGISYNANVEVSGNKIENVEMKGVESIDVDSTPANFNDKNKAVNEHTKIKTKNEDEKQSFNIEDKLEDIQLIEKNDDANVELEYSNLLNDSDDVKSNSDNVTPTVSLNNDSNVILEEESLNVTVEVTGNSKEIINSSNSILEDHKKCSDSAITEINLPEHIGKNTELQSTNESVELKNKQFKDIDMNDSLVKKVEGELSIAKKVIVNENSGFGQDVKDIVNEKESSESCTKADVSSETISRNKLDISPIHSPSEPDKVERTDSDMEIEENLSASISVTITEIHNNTARENFKDRSLLPLTFNSKQNESTMNFHKNVLLPDSKKVHASFPSGVSSEENVKIAADDKIIDLSDKNLKDHSLQKSSDTLHVINNNKINKVANQILALTEKKPVLTNAHFDLKVDNTAKQILKNDCVLGDEKTVLKIEENLSKIACRLDEEINENLKHETGVSSTEPPTIEVEIKENNELNEDKKVLVVEPKCVAKHISLLTDGSKEEEEEEESKLSPPSLGSPCSVGSLGLAADMESNSDIPDIPELEPLVCSEEESRNKEQTSVPLTLATFKLDTTDSPTFSHRELRKRKRPAPATNEDNGEVGEKKRKVKAKGKRTLDKELRRSIEEQKRQEISSSDDDDRKEKKSKESPKKGSSPKEKKKGKDISPSKESSPVNSSDAPSEASRTTTNTSPIKQANPRKKKKTLLGLEISLASETMINENIITGGGVRQSRRIAQIKIKEEAERRKLEEITLQELKDEQKKRKSKKDEDKDYKAEKRKRNKNAGSEDETTGDGESDDKKKKKRKHKDPRKIFDESNPWKSSSGSSSSEIEDDEEEIEPSEDESQLFKSDHEFSPESDLGEGGEEQPLKRARTVRKESDVDEELNDQACQKCGQSDHPEWILLCDKCDNGWHCSCLRPALLVIPEGDWFCPPCQHICLIENLESRLHEYDKRLSKRDMEVRRKQRLAYVGISLDNVLPTREIEDRHHHKQRQAPPDEGVDGDKEEDDDDDDDDDAAAAEDDSESDESESGSETSPGSESDSEPIYQLRERRQAHSYRFNDYDELINSAIQDELEAVKGAGNQGKGKDIATIVNAEKEEVVAQPKIDDTTDVIGNNVPSEVPVIDVAHPVPNEESEDDLIPSVKKKILMKKKHRRLNSLDVSSGDDDSASDEDFKGTSTETEEEEDDEEDDDDDDEFVAEDVTSESSEEIDNRRIKNYKDSGPVRRSTRARTSRYDRDFINDHSEVSEEEAPKRKKTKSTWDESESEESDSSWGRRKRHSKGSRKRSSQPTSKKAKKKKKKVIEDSDPEVFKNKKKPKIKFGGLNEEDADVRRTRGKKINYLEALGSDSDEEAVKRAPPRIIESEEEYIVNEDEELQADQEKDSDVSLPEFDESGNTLQLKTISPKSVSGQSSRGRGKSGLKLLRKPKETVPLPTDELLLQIGSHPIQSGPTLIEEINRNVEQVNPQMMEEEDYANKQLQLMALQLEKERKRKEQEKRDMLLQEQKVPKKRGRKPKNPLITNQLNQVPPLVLNSDIHNNAELSEPPGVSLPMFNEIVPMNFDPDSTLKKRRGRGKDTSASGSSTASPAPDSPLHRNKLGIAAPPQPFSQSQPAPSVITRMLQSQPGQPFSPGTPSKFFSGLPEDQRPNVTLAGSPGASTPSGQYLSGTGSSRQNLYQIPPAVNHYALIRGGPTPPHRLHSPGPQGMASLYHTHRTMDPSPSGGGTIAVDQNSAIASPGSPLSTKGDPTPPPPYTRPQVVRFPNASNDSTAGPPSRHLPLISHLQHQRPSNISPYHPSIPSNYYGAYPPPIGTGDDPVPPPAYQNSPYAEHYVSEGQPLHASDNGGKPFEEESGGEFGGLVSYFSSQREDDLDT